MKHSINLNYWKRSTGPTGQCLGTEINQDLYAECANLHKMVTGIICPRWPCTASHWIMRVM